MKNAYSCLLVIQSRVSVLMAMRNGLIERYELAHPEDSILPTTDTLTTTLDGLGLLGRPIGIGLSSEHCLAAAIHVDDLKRGLLGGGGNRQAWIYRLEENLPLAAEDLICDFISTGNQALGVACRRDWLATILRQLAAAGVRAAFACPVALLAFSNLSERHNLRSTDLLLWQHTSATEAFGLEQGRLTGWRWMACSPEAEGSAAAAVGQEIMLLGIRPSENNLQTSNADQSAGIELEPEFKHDDKSSLTPAKTIAVVERPPSNPNRSASERAGTNTDSTIADRTTNQTGKGPHSPTTNGTDRWEYLSLGEACMLDAATQQTAHILAQTHLPPVNLCRDELVADNTPGPLRTPLLAATLGIVLILGSLMAGLMHRTALYDHRTATLRQQEVEVFQRLFPNQPVPAGILTRLESETRRLAAIVELPDHVTAGRSALQTLYQTLRRLPDADQMRFRILELHFTDHSALLEGQTRSHADAERLAAALRQNDGLETDPPRTESLATEGVAFSLAARIRNPRPLDD